MADINIFALGGQDENGKDLYVIEVDQDIFIVNTGIKFPINDRWGVDGIIANTSYLKHNKNRIKGVFITHAHDETFAGLPWILMEMPYLKIFSSPFTKKLIENRISKYKIGHSKYQLNILENEKDFGSVQVKAHPVASSIPGSYGFEFITKDGSILFLSELTIGDLDSCGKTNLEAMTKNKVLTLLLDSRRANFIENSYSKRSIKKIIEPVFESAKHNERIIIGAYDEEMFTLQEIIELANKHQRPVIFYGSAFDSMFKAALENYSTVIEPFKTHSHKVIAKSKNAVILVTGTWSRIYQRFNRMSSNNDVFLQFKLNDNVIMITPPRNGMEVEYSQMLDEISKIAPNILSVSDKEFYPLRPTRKDVFEIVKQLKPEVFIPISSLYRYQVTANNEAIKAGVKKANTILLQNGKILYLQNGQIASQKGRIKEIGDVIIQGFGVGDVSFEVLRERKTLSAGGMVSIALQYNKKKRQFVGKINTKIVGIIIPEEIPHYVNLIEQVVLKNTLDTSKLDLREIQNIIRKKVQKLIRKQIDKEPLVIITFYEV